MVRPDLVVGYVPARGGVDAASYTFGSLESAEWILGRSGIYPVRQRAALHALDGLT